jgi:hypothetical protein
MYEPKELRTTFTISSILHINLEVIQLRNLIDTSNVKVFINSSNIKAPERTHGVNIYWECGKCGKAFTYPSFLEKHE